MSPSRSKGGIRAWKWMIFLVASCWHPVSGSGPAFVRASVGPSSAARFVLWKTLSGFGKGASEVERIGAFQQALPAIVEDGKTLLWASDTSDLCCSERSEVWVVARDLATGRDGRRWKIKDRDQSGANLLDSVRARRDFRELTRFFVDPGARTLGKWMGGIENGHDSSVERFEIDAGSGVWLRFPKPGILEIHRGGRMVSSRRMVGSGTCPSPDGDSMVRCPMPLRWVAGWSDSAAHLAVVRMESHEGCDGCEPKPLDLVLTLP